jgi:hypothetical protein
VTDPKGEAIVAPYSAVGRDKGQQREDADGFDITREQRRHLAFTLSLAVDPDDLM